VSSPPRDKDATWCSLSTLGRERDWSKRRLLHELQNGLRHRIVPPEAVPPGYVLDWRNPAVEDSLNVETSEVRLVEVLPSGSGGAGTYFLALGIEVLPPTNASPASSPSLPSPVATSSSPPTLPRKNVSEAELRQRLLDIVENHPPGSPPLDAETLWTVLETRLGASLARDRFRQALEDYAPQFKLPIGRPRKSAQ